MQTGPMDITLASNRIAAHHILQREQAPARLLFLYFLGDQSPNKDCPLDEDGWKPFIVEQRTHLGLELGHSLSDRGVALQRVLRRRQAGRR